MTSRSRIARLPMSALARVVHRRPGGYGQIRRLPRYRAIAWLVVVLCAQVLLARPPGCLAAQSPESMWVLEQEADLGKSVIYIAGSQVRFDDPGRGFSIICKAPEWRVVLFRDDERIMMDSPLRDWYAHGCYWHFGTYEGAPLGNQPTVATKYAGLDARTANLSESGSLRWMDGIDRQAAPIEYKGSTVTFTSQIPSASQISMFLQALYMLPRSSGVPLEFNYKLADGRQLSFLKTLKARRTDLLESKFNYPLNYNKASSHWQILVGSKNRQEIEDMARDMDLGRSFGVQSDRAKKP